MKRATLIWVVVCLGLVFFLENCSSPSSSEPPAKANVVMFEGPIYVEDELSFSYKGTVKNSGNKNAQFTKVYIYLRKSDNSLIDQEDTYVDDTDLAPQETSAWEWMWLDFDGSIRAKMDKTKTTFEIKWDE